MGRVGGVFYRERRRVVVVVEAREVIRRIILTLGGLSRFEGNVPATLAEPFPRSGTQQTHFFQDHRSTSRRTGTRGHICIRSLQCSYLYQFRLASELAPSCPATHGTLAVFGPSISHIILSCWGSHPTAIWKLMSTSSQGTSGPGGRAGFRPALERLVSGQNPAPEAVLTLLQQTSTEQSISNDIKRLTVRTSAEVFHLQG